ncbi:MAG: hypothetical protein HRU17_12755 [Polyangiaceae bacterium]|nr:hypothetical protein [Polyangiaceae bacterium]
MTPSTSPITRALLLFTSLRRSRAFLVAGLAVLSCVPVIASSTPQVTPSSTLSPAAMALANQSPFVLVHGGPQGQATADPSIQLVFSRPLRALGPDIPLPSGLRITPDVAGHWEWVGVHGITFVPDGGKLPRATKISVHVPKKLRALDGIELGEARDFEFITPVPRVRHVRPKNWARSETAESKIRLTFTQPVDPAGMKAFFRAHASGKDIPLSFAPAKLNNTIEITASKGFPLASLIQFELKPGWVGSEGPAPAKQRFTGSFRTYGPLTAKVDCGRDSQDRCLPDDSIVVQFSNLVNARKFTRGLYSTRGKVNTHTHWRKNATLKRFHLTETFRPGTSFTLRFLKALRDVHGQPLSGFTGNKIVIGDFSPRVQIGIEGDSLVGSENHVPVIGINTEYQLTVAALTGAELRKIIGMRRGSRLASLLSVAGTTTRTVKPKRRNVKLRENVDLDRLLRAQGGKGAFAIGVHYQVNGYHRSDVRWGQRTDLGVTAKRGRDQTSVWVTSLRTGKPITGAKVSVVDQDGISETDARGLAKLAPGQFVSTESWRGDLRWLEVRLGDEVVYRSTADSFGSWRIPVTTDFYGGNRDIAFLFPERNLFRPGESFRVKGYIRRPGVSGNEVPVGDELSIILSSPANEQLAKVEVTTNAFGGYWAKFKMPATAQTGYFRLTVKRGLETLTTSQVQVANYRRAEFEVQVAATESEAIAGDTAHFDVHGNYFFGGALRNSDVNYRITRAPESFTPPGAGDRVVDDSSFLSLDRYRHAPGSTLGHGSAKLDGVGVLKIDTQLLLPHQVGAERVELEAEISDVSRQAQSGRSSVLVHPANYYLALERPESLFIDAPGVVNSPVLALRPDGTRVTGRKISMSLVRVRYTHVKQRSSGGASHTLSERVVETVSRCVVYSAKLPRSCPLKIPAAGYFVVRASSEDKKSRPMHSSFGTYGIADSGESYWRDHDDKAAVTLSLDKKLYQVGQTARLLIQSPFKKARAWVTVERDGIISQKMVKISGPAPSLNVSIGANMRPNAFVSVHLVEDREALGSRAHAIGDSFRFGYINLRVDPESRRLAVGVQTDRAEYRPGETVKLRLDVKDIAGNGQKAELTVFAVDEGVLSLSGYQMRDPLRAFIADRPLRVETLEGREWIAKLTGLSEEANKGDPGGDGGSARGDNLTTAYFNPSIITDDSGHATAQFKLPDNLGRFRLMALAVSPDDRYGRGGGSLTVNKKLMVRPALPRFLRAGDKFEMSVVVSSQLATEAQAVVKVAVAGLQLIDTAKKTTTVGGKSSVEVFFKARATSVGSAKVRFDVSVGKFRDAVERKLNVDSPGALEAVALYGKTDSAEAHELGELAALREDRGGLDVTLSSSALVGLKGSFEQLSDYPYACTEQLSSRVMPLLALGDLSRIYGMPVPDNAEHRIASDIARIIKRQRGDGGFGLWPESPQSYAWVSSYALWILQQAAEHGVAVPDSVFTRGKRYLATVAAVREAADLPGATFAVFVLAKLGQKDPSTLHALFDRRSDMPVFARSVLLWGAALQLDSHDGALTTLLEELESSITIRGNRAEIADPQGESLSGYMTSSTRRHALALNALIAARPDHPLAAKLVRALLEARDGGRWGSTQESAFALLGLDAYRRAQEQTKTQFEAHVYFGDSRIGSKKFAGHSLLAQGFSTPMKKLGSGKALIFQKLGRGSLFYEARLRYVRRQLPTTPLESGFLVSKTMRKWRRNASSRKTAPVGPDSKTYEAGDLVKVDVTVLAPQKRRFVVIDDPLPAGLEAVDMSLATSSADLRTGLQNGYATAWHRQELRDDRVLNFVDEMPPGIYRYSYLARATTRGSFIVPPTFAKEMYQEEVFGRTGASQVHVQ